MPTRRDFLAAATAAPLTAAAAERKPNILFLMPDQHRAQTLGCMGDEQAQTPTGIVVPQQAVQRGSTGDSVMVVDGEGKVMPRPVKVGTAQGGNWVILDGVKTGEMVMVDGFQKLRGPGPVKPVPWQPRAASVKIGRASCRERV